MVTPPTELPSDLSAAIAEARARLRVGYPWWLRPFLMRDVVAITLGRRIYLRHRAGLSSFERIVRHELAHVRQVNRLGLVRFLWKYLSEFVGHWRRLRAVSPAYAQISFEIEACAAEEAGGENRPYNHGGGAEC
ncbi:MAG: hypothetical protein ABI779_26195, partial [Acidobacteriota bacterium]